MSSAPHHACRYMLHAPTRSYMHLHMPSRACWHHCWHNLATSTLVASSANVISSRHRWRHLQIDFDLRQLTLSTLTLTSGELTVDLFRVDFCNPGASYPVFQVDFIFAIHFCIFCFQMKNKDKSSSFCNNCRQKSNKCFCNFCKRFGHNIETCYQRNKSAVSISAATVANTESVQPMAPISAQSQSSRSTFTISKDSLINIIANVIRMVVMHLISLLSQFYLVCLLPLGLWILLVVITWHLTRPYFLNFNLHHTLLIFTQQMVPQCLVIISDRKSTRLNSSHVLESYTIHQE